MCAFEAAEGLRIRSESMQDFFTDERIVGVSPRGNRNGGVWVKEGAKKRSVLGDMICRGEGGRRGGAGVTLGLGMP